MHPLPSPNRRAFLKLSTATAAALSAPNIVFGEPDSKRLKIGLIGCGGRGGGAARNALAMDTNTELWAMGDAFGGPIEATIEGLRGSFHERVNADPSRQFIGLDSYQKVLETNPDVVILTTPPGFRPEHLRAAVEAGKHVFCEKPVAVDMTGIRSVLESAKMAKQKGLSLVCGFCWRYNKSRRAAFDRILNQGAIGDITSIYATYYTGPVKPMPPAGDRKESMSDLEWQVRNWYNFSWLSGDSLVEQAVHSVDKTAWAMRDANPVSCIANGGRQIPAEGGNIFDHFNCVYEYQGGALVHVANRQIRNCANENADHIAGTKGSLIINGGRVQIMGETKWSYPEEDAERDRDMYDQEHVELFESIRNHQAKNDGEWMAHSSSLAIMGRMAAYSGKRITWEQLLASKEDLAPAESLHWDSSFTPHPMPLPGKYQLV